MTSRTTYVDANILIAAFQANGTTAEAALEILDDPDRVFVISAYLRLETVPKPTFHKRQVEIEFMETFFSAASVDIESSSSVTSRAIEFASRYDLSPVDALHVSAAVAGCADEFVTLEKPNKPLHQVEELTVVALLR